MMNMFKRKTLVISERDPEYKVKYLGNVLTAFVKGEGCVDKPTQVLWNNYLTNCANSQTGSAGLDMEMRICSSGLKVVTKEQGLTEYRAHRITYSICPQLHPKLFVWVYRHDGKNSSRKSAATPCSARLSRSLEPSLPSFTIGEPKRSTNFGARKPATELATSAADSVPLGAGERGHVSGRGRGRSH